MEAAPKDSEWPTVKGMIFGASTLVLFIAFLFASSMGYFFYQLQHERTDAKMIDFSQVEQKRQKQLELRKRRPERFRGIPVGQRGRLLQLTRSLTTLPNAKLAGSDLQALERDLLLALDGGQESALKSYELLLLGILARKSLAKDSLEKLHAALGRKH